MIDSRDPVLAPTAANSLEAPAGTGARGPGRRSIAAAIVGAAGTAAGLGAGTVIGSRAGRGTDQRGTDKRGTDQRGTDQRGTDQRGTGPVAAAGAGEATVDPRGPHQAGVARPLPAPDHLTLVVADLTPSARVGPLLVGLGRFVRRLSAGDDPALLGLSPRRLTVTVGLGPRVVAGVDRSLPGAVDLPPFAREQRIGSRDRGGDLALQVAADDPVVVGLAVAALTGSLAGSVTARWSQSGFRGPAEGTAARNVLGFTDGIVVPATDQQLDDSVWLPASQPRVGGGTVMVVRRLALDAARFARLPVAEQERAVGRRRATGEPLSGGSGTAEVDLRAKTPDGRYVVPALAHARRAHPLAVGAGLMMRRSYSIADASGPGLLFVSFQRELRSFVATQRRLDDGDALLAYATPTASATFLVLPGFDGATPLGATLFP